MKITMLDIKDIKPYIKNPRNNNDAVSGVAKSNSLIDLRKHEKG